MSLLPLVLALTPAPAASADWWWVQGDPQDAAISFANARSAVRNGDQASIRVVSVDRTGQSVERVVTVRCPASPKEGPARFACGTGTDRMTWAAMLGGMTPRDAAQALFAGGERREARARLAD
jgi:hypothetical protein